MLTPNERMRTGGKEFLPLPQPPCICAWPTITPVSRDELLISFEDIIRRSSYKFSARIFSSMETHCIYTRWNNKPYIRETLQEPRRKGLRGSISRAFHRLGHRLRQQLLRTQTTIHMQHTLVYRVTLIPSSTIVGVSGVYKRYSESFRLTSGLRPTSSCGYERTNSLVVLALEASA